MAKGGYYPTPDRVADRIAAMIAPVAVDEGSDVRILDPCCGTGAALEVLKRRITDPSTSTGELTAYGVELHSDRAEEAAGRLDHVLNTDLFATSIANGAFSLLLLNPPYDFDSGDTKRTEHAFLMHCTRFLDEGGLLVYIVPRNRLAVSARYLAGNYRGIDCYAFPEPERELFDQVVLFGRKKREPHAEPHQERLIAAVAHEGAPELPEAPVSPLYVRVDYRKDILFANRVVDPVVAAREARVRGLWAKPEVRDAIWPVEEEYTRPLMPLRKGHMAMLVAAGFLNNLVLRNRDGDVLVKGKTAKIAVPLEDDDSVIRERMTTTVNVLHLDTGELEEIAS